MAKEKPATERANLWLTSEAVALLGQLATPNRRGAFLSELIKRAAREQGLIEGMPSAPATLDMAALQLQLQAAHEQVQQAQEFNHRVQTHYEDLLARVAAALAQQPAPASEQ